jgi:hypothetical protein
MIVTHKRRPGRQNLVCGFAARNEVRVSLPAALAIDSPGESFAVVGGNDDRAAFGGNQFEDSLEQARVQFRIVQQADHGAYAKENPQSAIIR